MPEVVKSRTGATSKLDAEARAIDEIVESLLFNQLDHLRRYALLQLSTWHNGTWHTAQCRANISNRTILFYTPTQVTALAQVTGKCSFSNESSKKGKVFPYSLPSVGPGADPGVQAVSPAGDVKWITPYTQQ